MNKKPSSPLVHLLVSCASRSPSLAKCSSVRKKDQSWLVWLVLHKRVCSSVRKKNYQKGMLVLHCDGVLVVDKMV